VTRVAAVLVVFAVLAAGSPVAANGSADAHPGRVLFEQAEAKFNLGRFEEALVDYQGAYQVEPLPAFLFNVGQCYRNLGHYERAQFFFRRYIALDPRSPNRSTAERLIAEMDKLAGERAGEAASVPALASDRQMLTPAPFAAPAAAAGPAATTRAITPIAPQAGDDGASSPVYRRTWFWVAVAAVVVGGVAVGFAAAQDDPRSSLHPIDTRGAL
jgi:tetratricopeptide (TPR) repeat protein